MGGSVCRDGVAPGSQILAAEHWELHTGRNSQTMVNLQSTPIDYVDSWPWSFSSAAPALRRLRQEDPKFQGQPELHETGGGVGMLLTLSFLAVEGKH